MEQQPQQQGQAGFASEDEEATYCLSLLRDGDRHQKIVARERLSQIFERRGLLDEAAQCLESNVREGVRDPRVYQRLAGVYRRQGRHELADEVMLEARRLAERLARAQQPGARRPVRPAAGRPAPTAADAPAGQPPTGSPGLLDAPTATMPAPTRTPEPGQPDDFGLDPVAVGMGSASAVAAQPTRRPWWASPAMVALLVLLLGPFGVALMWVNAGYSRATNIRVSAIWAALMVLLLAGAAVTVQSQLAPLLAGATAPGAVPRVPGLAVQPPTTVFGTPQPAVGAKPTLPAGLAVAPPSPPPSPVAAQQRPGGTLIGPAPAAKPAAEPKPEGNENDDAAPAPPAESAPKPQGERVKVEAGGGGANLRERPGSSAPVIKTVPEGATLSVVGGDQPMDGKTWKNVRDEGGAQGWMAAELLQPAQ